MALTNEEKETIIRWDKSGDTVTIYTHEVALINKLKRSGAKLLNEGKFQGTPWAKFEVTRRWIKVSKPVKRKRGDAMDVD
jgi:hypothetical protein